MNDNGPLDPLMIAKAQALEHAMAYDNPEGRRWLRIGQADSYDGATNRVEAWLLEGSPARGFILFLIGTGTIYRLGGDGRRLKTFLVYAEQ